MVKKRKIIMYTAFVFYVAVAAILLFGDDIFLRDGNRYELLNHANLKPFSEIKRYVLAIKTGSIPMWNIICNLLGNILLFTPLVCFMCHMSPVFKKWFVTLPLCAVVIGAVEWMQYYFKRGSMDIDDFILNFIGCTIMFLIIKIWESRKDMKKE